MLTAALATLLDELGHGVYGRTGTDIFLGELPAKPTDAIAIMFSPGMVDNAVDGYARTSIQVLVRRTATTGRSRTGYAAAAAIRDDLNGLTHTTLAPDTDDETRLVSLFSDDGGPTSLGDDGNGTPRWSLRFVAVTTHDTANTRL